MKAPATGARARVQKRTWAHARADLMETTHPRKPVRTRADERSRAHAHAVGRLLASLILAAATFLACFPLTLLVAGSLMDAGELATSLGGFLVPGTGYAQLSLPQHPTLASYVGVLVDESAFHVLFQNSAVVTAGTLTGQLLLATPAAWALARYRFPGRGVLLFLYTVLMMMPFQVLMLPSYLALTALGINNTLLALVLPGAASAFPVFVMRHFFAGIPEPLLEAARLDGAGELRIFLRIGVPLGAPGIAAALVLGFFEYWNLVEQPLAFLKDQALWPLSLFQPAVTTETAGLAFAAAVVAAAPAVLVFLLGRDQLERGFGAAARKEDS